MCKQLQRALIICVAILASYYCANTHASTHVKDILLDSSVTLQIEDPFSILANTYGIDVGTFVATALQLQSNPYPVTIDNLLSPNAGNSISFDTTMDFTVPLPSDLFDRLKREKSAQVRFYSHIVNNPKLGNIVANRYLAIFPDKQLRQLSEILLPPPSHRRKATSIVIDAPLTSETPSKTGDNVEVRFFSPKGRIGPLFNSDWLQVNQFFNVEREGQKPNAPMILLHSRGDQPLLVDLGGHLHLTPTLGQIYTLYSPNTAPRAIGIREATALLRRTFNPHSRLPTTSRQHPTIILGTH